MKNFRWDKKYLYWGVTAFAVIACSILFFMLLQYFAGIRTAVNKVLRIFSPMIWGFAIAYILNPLVGWLERVLTGKAAARICKKNENRRAGLKRGMAIVLSLLIALIIVGALFYLVLPQVYQSVESIVVSLPGYITVAIAWVERMLKSMPELEQTVVSTIGSISSFVTNWASETFLPQIDTIVTNVTTGVYSVVRELINIIIGVVASVYMLYNKETFIAQSKKILYSLLSAGKVETLLKALNKTDKAFIGFIDGKLIDSLIIGVLCYIGCLILRIPYAVLVSVIIGVTNIIPFFGPFIGAIPSALIILMQEPVKCLVFLIFILVLQQFDGNVLGPKILGNTTGLSGFWILFAITVGAGIFGFAGMILGVPVFVVLYAGIKHFVESKLKKRGLPQETAKYKGIDHIDPDTGEAVPKEEKKRERFRPEKVSRASEKAQDEPDGDDPPDK